MASLVCTLGADHARQMLAQLLSQQGGILRQRKQVLRSGLPTEAAGVTDAEERCLEAEEQDLGFSLLELTSRTVREIEGALLRLEAGDFGTCSECRQAISEARLRALPFAALCLACQQQRDALAAAASRATAGARERIAS